MGQAFPQLLLPCQPLDALHSAPVPEQPLEQSGPAQVGGQRRNSRHHLGAHQEESREGRKEGWRAKSWTRLSDFTFPFHFHALEKEMATHSSVLAWRIPGMAEPGGLLPMGLHRVGHD